jgi:hypothetical protein
MTAVASVQHYSLKTVTWQHWLFNLNDTDLDRLLGLQQVQAAKM